MSPCRQVIFGWTNWQQVSPVLQTYEIREAFQISHCHPCLRNCSCSRKCFKTLDFTETLTQHSAILVVLASGSLCSAIFKYNFRRKVRKWNDIDYPFFTTVTACSDTSSTRTRWSSRFLCHWEAKSQKNWTGIRLCFHFFRLKNLPLTSRTWLTLLALDGRGVGLSVRERLLDVLVVLET